MRKADIPPGQLSLNFDSVQTSTVAKPTNLSNVVQFGRRIERLHGQVVREATLNEDQEIIQRVLTKAKSLGW
jgi:hypothetical protein